jgi:hypothetical protein
MSDGLQDDIASGDFDIEFNYNSINGKRGRRAEETLCVKAVALRALDFPMAAALRAAFRASRL